MKFKHFFLNLLFFIFFLFLIEGYLYIFVRGNTDSLPEKYNARYSLNLERRFDNIYLEIIKPKFRKPLLSKTKNDSILILGCSYAFGHMLSDEETLSYKLWQQTQMNVYNRAFDFYWGFHNAYYQLLRNDFYNEVKNVKVIIYVYINDQIPRAKGIYMDDVNNTHFEYLRYILKNGNFQQYSFWSKYPILNFNILRNIRKNLYLLKMTNKNFDETGFCEKFFIEMRKIAVSHWGKDIKFVILNYENNNNELMQKLQEDDFLVYNLSDFTDKDLLSDEYQVSSNDDHPNEKAWDIIVPELVKKLNLSQ